MPDGGMLGPDRVFEKMDHHLPQEAPHRVQLRQAHVLDLFDDMRPIDGVDTLPPFPAFAKARPAGPTTPEYPDRKGLPAWP